jgi:hypothetical protein
MHDRRRASIHMHAYTGACSSGLMTCRACVVWPAPASLRPAASSAVHVRWSVGPRTARAAHSVVPRCMQRREQGEQIGRESERGDNRESETRRRRCVWRIIERLRTDGELAQLSSAGPQLSNGTSSTHLQVARRMAGELMMLLMACGGVRFHSSSAAPMRTPRGEPRTLSTALPMQLRGCNS